MEIVSKITGSSLTATEFNQIPDELENLISKGGLTPSSSDVTQVTKAVAQYVADGDFYATSGTANAIVLSAISPRVAPTVLNNGLRARFKASYNNTGATTINVNNLGAKDVLVEGSPLQADQIVADTIYSVYYNSTSDSFQLDVVKNLTTQISTAITTVLTTLYPVGSVYIGTQETCPLASLIPGSTWTQITGRYLVASGTLPGTSETISANGYATAGLPNISGNIYAGVVNNNASADGAFALSWWGGRGTATPAGYNGAHYDYSASRSNSVFGQSATVRPAGYGVNVWRRTA